jgi:hypothetical protein
MVNLYNITLASITMCTVVAAVQCFLDLYNDNVEMWSLILSIDTLVCSCGGGGNTVVFFCGGNGNTALSIQVSFCLTLSCGFLILFLNYLNLSYLGTCLRLIKLGST